MLKRTKHLGAALAVVVLVAGSTQAAHSPDGTPGAVMNGDIKKTTPEPFTMIVLGTGLLAAFRARRHQQA